MLLQHVLGISTEAIKRCYASLVVPQVRGALKGTEDRLQKEGRHSSAFGSSPIDNDDNLLQRTSQNTESLPGPSAYRKVSLVAAVMVW
jgi:hypothetical protein